MRIMLSAALLFIFALLPSKSSAVQCPIPNCPAGQLCFCPPPPPHYLVVRTQKGKNSLLRAITQRFRANFGLTGYFTAAKRFRPKRHSASTPLDQISPWHQLSVAYKISGKRGSISVILFKRATPRSSKKAKMWSSAMTFNGANKHNVANTVDLLSNQIMAKILGRPFSAFNTNIAYVHRLNQGRSVIRLGKVNGVSKRKGEMHPIVSYSRSLNMEPLFSPTGEYLIFTSHIRYNKDLYITKLGNKKIHRISARRGVNHAASFSPNGKLLALTLTLKGNPDVFLLKSDYKTTKKWRITKKVTRHHLIDTSPAFSPDGKSLVFVSTRRGRAQIFIKDLTKNRARPRLFFATNNRTYTPKWCKSGTREFLAFTQLVGKKSVIFIYNMQTKRGWRATSLSAPSAENPSWSPNCNLIAYESNGSKAGSKGIFVSPIVGGRSVALFAGPFTMPTWGK